MKNKKILILTIIFLITTSIAAYIIYNNRTVATITMEINPSFKIELKKDNKIKKVIAYNKDAKDIITNNLKGKELNTALNIITENLITSKYVEDMQIEIKLYSTGNLDSEEIRKTIEKDFQNKSIHCDIEVVEIDKEAEELAKKKNISVIKASYINEIIKENNNIKTESLIDKSIKELKETKDTGNYCDDGYTLEVDFCKKEISREKATKGDVCPNGYYEYENKCYEEIRAIELDKYTCENDDILDYDKCISEIYTEAEASFTCEVGTLIKRREVKNREIRDNGDESDYLCEDKSSATYPVERCYLQEHAIINGKCAMGPKPLLPTPTGCEGHDINYNGGCYDPYPDEPYICPNGERFDTNEELCADTYTYTYAKGEYKCPEGSTLEKDRCKSPFKYSARREVTCPENYTLIDNGRCINKSKTKNKERGLVCPKENSQIENNECITYEYVKAKNDR